MPHHKSAIKRVKTNALRRLRNRAGRSRLRTVVKNMMNMETKEAALAKLRDAMSIIDKSAKMGLIHKNNAARKKSKIMKRINSLS